MNTRSDLSDALLKFVEINEQFRIAAKVLDGNKRIKPQEINQYLINYLSTDLLLDPQHFNSVSNHFSKYIPELLRRALNSDEKHVLKAILLGNLIKTRPDLGGFALKYFSESPSAFQHFEIGESDSKKPKSDSIKYEELQFVESCYYLLKSDPEFYGKRWNWSEFLAEYLQHENDKIKWISRQIFAVIFGMPEAQLDKLISNAINVNLHRKYLCDFNLKGSLYEEIIAPVLNQNPTFAINNPAEDLINVSGLYVPIISKNSNVKTDLIEVESTIRNLSKLALGLSLNKAICLQGPVGSGKTTLVEYLAEKTGRNLGDDFIKVQLGDQTDGKMLLGTYRCTDVPGEFLWQPGVLTQAVLEGHWLLLEDIDSASMDVASMLSSFLENKCLTVPGYRDSVQIAPGFQLFLTHRFLSTISGPRKKHSSSLSLLEKQIFQINVDPLTRPELQRILDEKHPEFLTISDRLVDVFLLFERKIEEIVAKSGRCISARDFFKFCARAVVDFDVKNPRGALKILQDAVDVFCCSSSDRKYALDIAKRICTILGIVNQKAEYFINDYKPIMRLTSERFVAGRVILPRNNEEHSLPINFSFTRQSSVLLERVMCCVKLEEPVLLVGETGTGKTSCVQYLAGTVGQKLVVINMNQQSDSADLLGGFKPVDLKYIVSPIRDEFERAFVDFFNVEPNRKYLGFVAAAFNDQKWSHLVKLMNVSCRAAVQRMRTSVKEFEASIKSTKEMEALKRSAKEFEALKQSAEKFDALKRSVEEFEALKRSKSEYEALKKSAEKFEALKKSKSEYEALEKSANDFEALKQSAEKFDALKRSVEEFEALKRSKSEYEALKKSAEKFEALKKSKSEYEALEKSANDFEALKQSAEKFDALKRSVEEFEALKRSKSEYEALKKSAEKFEALKKSKSEYEALEKSANDFEALKQSAEKFDALKRSVEEFEALKRSKSEYEALKKSAEKFEALKKSKSEYEALEKSANDFEALKQSAEKFDALKRSVEEFEALKRSKSEYEALKKSAEKFEALKKSKSEYEALEKSANDFEALKQSAEKFDALKRSVEEFEALKRSKSEYEALKKSAEKFEALKKSKSEYEALEKSANDFEALKQSAEKFDALKRSVEEFEALKRSKSEYEALKKSAEKFEALKKSKSEYEALEKSANDFEALKQSAEKFDALKRSVEEFEALKRSKSEYEALKKSAEKFEALKKSKSEYEALEKSANDFEALKQSAEKFDALKRSVEEFEALKRSKSEYEALKKSAEKFEALKKSKSEYEALEKSANDFEALKQSAEKFDALKRSVEEFEALKRSKSEYEALKKSAEKFEALKKSKSEYEALEKSANDFEALKQSAEKFDALKRSVEEFEALKRSKSEYEALKKSWNEFERTKQFLDKKTIEEYKRYTKQSIFLERWEKIGLKLNKLELQLKHTNALAFSFIEGSLVEAVEKGYWVLLDEINLANAETLECLSGLLEGSRGSLCLLERGDKKPIKRHPNFTLFACMNPSTDVGKKDLPFGLRNRFTEFFVDELDERIDLLLLVNNYLATQSIKPKDAERIVDFYLKVRKETVLTLSDGSGHKPHYSLRSLCRALIVAAKNPCGTFKRSLYEAFCLSFLTQLDSDSYRTVEKMISSYLIGDAKSLKAVLNQPIPRPSGTEREFLQFEGYWVKKGQMEPLVPERYILTDSVRKNLKDLVRVVSIGKLPVLLQGDTSVGKTSLITYLATSSGNKCVRINNHEHTDLQEYVGGYAAAPDGRLVFREGLLVEAMRKGHWIILDELNLAPSDVLEALNRVLDDNRELFIPETRETVKANENFMLFATQNPPGAYGGRKTLSRAFRNRFVELHFNEIPPKELEFILHQRCEMAPSYAKKMINVMTDLQVRRRGSAAFAGKQGFVTLRDLFRWGERYRLARNSKNLYDWDQHLADEGYLVLAGKVRKTEEKNEIISVLEKRLRRVVDPENLFTLSDKTSNVTRHILEKIEENETKHANIVWTFNLRQLAVSVSKALDFKEPVLLVGETGGGKTTVCRLIADNNCRRLVTVNCHMHTESSDFIGGLRPVRDHSSGDSKKLFEWVDGPLIESMVRGDVFLADEISLADDSVLERLNSLLEPERSLLLAEKGIEATDSRNSELITAHPDFRFVGTMNPGGDFGKKELSPALRNRFTEIWCESRRNREDSIDIIERNVRPGLSLGNQQDGTSGIGIAVVDFLEWFEGTEVGKRCTISVRDILTWVNFLNVCSDKMDISEAYVHGACLTFLDGLGSGTTGAESSTTLDEFRTVCLEFLSNQIAHLTASTKIITDVRDLIVDASVRKFGVGPFYVDAVAEKVAPNGFAFDSPTTLYNTLRLLRAMQLNKAILLEGSPGVGKTSLVTALAKFTGHELVRINLSDQTDASDLFGSDLPVEGAKGGRFSWRDGPLLRALRDASWILLDELNLASQSVLEGLNACLDHRGEIFIPELGRTFRVAPGTRFFGCQNPSKEGGSRRGLPRSFLNRFVQVHVNALTAADLSYILENEFGSVLTSDLLRKMVDFNARLSSELAGYEFGHRGSPWECNLRDLARWCEATARFSNGRPENFVKLIYGDRMRTLADKERVVAIFEEVFRREIGGARPVPYVTDDKVMFGDVFIERRRSGVDPNVLLQKKSCLVLRTQLETLRSLAYCVKSNWMAILVGGAGSGKSGAVKTLAQLAGKDLKTLPVTSAMDTTDILGGFEQTDYSRHLEEIQRKIETLSLEIMQKNLLEDEIDKVLTSMRRWETYRRFSETTSRQSMEDEVKLYLKKIAKLDEILKTIVGKENETLVGNLSEKLKNIRESIKSDSSLNAGGKFEWVDSVLIKCLRDGLWLLIDNVNLCSSAVLDRLNALLEPSGVLTVSERGVDAEGKTVEIKPHPEFRLFLAMDPKNGEISRAMRNRGVEIYLLNENERGGGNFFDRTSLVNAEGLKSPYAEILIDLHDSIAESIVGEKPNVNDLIDVSLVLARRLKYDANPIESFVNATIEVYYKTRCADEFSCEDFAASIRESITDRLRNGTPPGYIGDASLKSGNISFEKIRQQSAVLAKRLRNKIERIDYVNFDLCVLLQNYYSITSREDLELRHVYIKEIIIDALPDKRIRNTVLSIINRLYRLVKSTKTESEDLPLDKNWISEGIIDDSRSNRLNVGLSFAVQQFLAYVELEIESEGRVYLDEGEIKFKPPRGKKITLMEYATWVRDGKIENRVDNIVIIKFADLHDQFRGYVNSISSSALPLTDDRFIDIVYSIFWWTKLFRCFSIDLRRAGNASTNLSVHWNWFRKFALKKLDSDVLPITRRLDRIAKEIDSKLNRQFSAFHKLARNYRKGGDRPPPFTTKERLEVERSYAKLYERFDATLPRNNPVDVFKAWTSNAQLRNAFIVFKTSEDRNGAELLSKIEQEIDKTEARDVSIFELRAQPIFDAVARLRLKRAASAQTGASFLNDVLLPIDLIATIETYNRTGDNRLSNEISKSYYLYLMSSPAVKPAQFSLGAGAVLSEFAPKLTYLLTNLLIGSTKETTEITLGNFRHVSKQQESLNLLLWRNFHQLSEERYSFASIEKRNVSIVYRTFILQLATTLKLNTASNDPVDILTQRITSKLEEITKIDSYVDPDGEIPALTNSLTNCLNFYTKLKTADNDDIESIIDDVSKLYRHVAVLKSKFNSKLSIIDPLAKKTIKKNYCRDARATFETMKNCYERLNEIYGRTENSRHAYCAPIEKMMKQLEEKRDELSEFVAYRPEDVLYETVYEDVRHAFSTILSENPDDEVDDETNLERRLEVQTNKVASYENLIHQLNEFKTSFPDIIEPLLCNVAEYLYGFKLHLANLRLKMNRLNRNEARIMERLVSFPILNRNQPRYDGHVDLLSGNETKKFVHRVFEDEETPFIENRERLRMLKTAIVESFNNIVVDFRINDKLNPEYFEKFDELVDVFVGAYNKQIERNEKRKEEEESLYKIRTKCDEKPEETRIADDLLRLFPNYHSIDFSDLDDDTRTNPMETEHEPEPEAKIDAPIRPEDLEIVVDLHAILLKNFTESEWLNPPEKNRNVAPDFPAALAGKFESFSAILNGTVEGVAWEMDGGAVGGLSVLLAGKRAVLEGRGGKGGADFYGGCDVDEAKDCLGVLRELEIRAEELLAEWPDQPTLKTIVAVVRRIYDFEVASPLSRFLTGFEMLLSKCHEWEQVAHSGVSLAAHRRPLTDRIIRWRKSELSAWKNSLDRVHQRLREPLPRKWWLHIYNVMRQFARRPEREEERKEQRFGRKEHGFGGKEEESTGEKEEERFERKERRFERKAHGFGGKEEESTGEKEEERFERKERRFERKAHGFGGNEEESTGEKEEEERFERKEDGFGGKEEESSGEKEEESEFDRKTLIETLQTFVTKSNLAEFRGRIDLLYVFHCHAVNLRRTEEIDYFVCVLWNVYVYFKQFVEIVDKKVKDLRAPIEKKLKDYVKIVRWKDVNYWAIKETVDKSHKTLHKFMREYQEILERPVLPYLTNNDCEVVADIGIWDKKKKEEEENEEENTYYLDGLTEQKNYLIDMRTVEEIENTKDELIASIHRSIGKTRNAFEEIISKSAHGNAVKDLYNFLNDVIETGGHLRKLEVNTSLPKEKQKSQAKSILQRKHRALADLFKHLTEIGLSYKTGLLESKRKDPAFEFSLKPVDLIANFAHRNYRHEETKIEKMWKNTEKYYTKSSMRFDVLENALRNPSKDLGPRNIERCKGFAQHLLILIQNQKSDLANASRTFNALRNYQYHLKSFTESEEFLRLTDVDAILKTLTKVILVLEQYEIILSTCPEDGGTVETPVLESEFPDDKIAYKNDGSWIETANLIESIKRSINQVCIDLNNRKGEMPAVFVTPRRLVPIIDSNRLKYRLNEIKRNLRTVGNRFGNENLLWLEEELETNVKNISDVTNISDREGKIDLESITNRIETVAERLKRNSDEKSIANQKLQQILIDNLSDDLKELDRTGLAESIGKSVGFLLESIDRKSIAASFSIILEQFVLAYRFFLTQAVAGYRANSKTCSILLNVFIDLATKGFCVPPEFSEEFDEEGMKRPSDGLGLGEGEGQKDVSDKIESEDQLDDARPAGEDREKEEEDSECKEEEKGIEMSEDFDGKLQDKEKKEDEENEEKEESGDSDAEEQMGETEKGAEQSNKETFGERETGEEEENPEEKEERGEGGEKEEGEAELGANENRTSKENEEEKETDEKSGSKEKEKKEINEMDEPEYDDDQIDPHHGNRPDLPEPEPMDLPDDMQLDDGDEKDQENEEEENPFDIDTMKTDQVPEDKNNQEEEEEESKEKDDERDFSSDDEDVNKTDKDKNNEDQEGKKDDEELASENKTNDIIEEENSGEEETDKEKEEESGADQTRSRQDNIEPMETDEAETTDKTRSDNSESQQKSSEPLDEFSRKEEEPDREGVGHSNMEEASSGHSGRGTKKSTKEKEEKEEEDERKRKQKPGESDSKRSLGDANEPVKKKLKTVESNKEEKEEEEEESGDKEETAEMYKHIKEAKKRSRTQILDAATKEQIDDQKKGKELRLQEEEKEEDLLEEEEDEATEVDDTENQRRDDDKTEGKSKEKKLRQNQFHDETSDDVTTIDGDRIETQTARRDARTSHHTLHPPPTPEPTRLSPTETNELRLEVERQLARFSDAPNDSEAERTWLRIASLTAELARDLSEQLRLVLEPTRAARLKGDYRTGKRINMRKVIPYVASEYRKDKIWTRRTKPSKREYRIVLAIDDSSSMADNRSKELAFESVALISRALTLLESGQLSVLSFGERCEVVHKLEEPFTERSGAKLLRKFKFEEKETKVGKLVDFAVETLGGGGATATAKLLVIVGDGRGVFSEGEGAVRGAARRAKLADVLVVFVVLDNPENKNSILDIRMPVFEGGKLREIRSYMDEFPFSFYIILRDVNSLPGVLSDALRQWFEIVANLDK